MAVLWAPCNELGTPFPWLLPDRTAPRPVLRLNAGFNLRLEVINPPTMNPSVGVVELATDLNHCSARLVTGLSSLAAGWPCSQ